MRRTLTFFLHFSLHATKLEEDVEMELEEADVACSLSRGTFAILLAPLFFITKESSTYCSTTLVLFHPPCPLSVPKSAPESARKLIQLRQF